MEKRRTLQELTLKDNFLFAAVMMEQEKQYILFEEMMSRERAEGKAEGKAEGITEGITVGKAEAILEILEAYGEVPENLRSRIMSIKDNRALRQLVKYAVQATTISEFESMLNVM